MQPVQTLFPSKEKLTLRSSPTLQTHLATDLFDSIIRITTYINRGGDKSYLYTYVEGVQGVNPEDKDLWKKLVELAGDGDAIFDYFNAQFPDIPFFKDKTIRLVREAGFSEHE